MGNNKVIYKYCKSYEYENVKSSIFHILSSLPELQEKLNTDKPVKVLIKPNLLSPRAPEKAVTTHPTVIRAVIEYLEQFNCEIAVGDTPAGPYNTKILERLYSTCEMTKAVEGTSAKLNFDLSDTLVDIPNGKTLKKLLMIKPAEEADIIINVAKLKTHTFTRLTCAAKNLFGLMPGVIKFRQHLAMPDLKVFGQMLVDINTYLNGKVFHVVDGITGMEGMGPSGGDPKFAGALFGGTDSEAVDILACHIMGMPVNTVPTIINRKSINDIELVVSDNVATYEFNLPPVRLKSIPETIPQWMQDTLTELIIAKPIINSELCKKCNICVESCPAQIMEIREQGAIVKEYKKCIRCYCCQEGCPFKAIELSQPFVEKCYRFVRKLRKAK